MSEKVIGHVASYGEPWRSNPISGGVKDKNGIPAFSLRGEPGLNLRRAIACVNACAGMEDPEQEIAALRSQATRAPEMEQELKNIGLFISDWAERWPESGSVKEVKQLTLKIAEITYPYVFKDATFQECLREITDISLPPNEEKCPECGGSGKERMPAIMDCETCGGTGKKE